MKIQCAPWRVAVSLCVVPLLAACGDSAADWAGTVTDSAGVAIVANPSDGLWQGPAPWTMIEDYRVGGMNADPDAQFGQVPSLDVDGDGNVYVADAQAAQIRVFGPDGAFLHTIGSPGQGPGEIGQALAAVFVVGGEVWAADVANQRLNRYGLDGTSLGSLPLEFTRGIPIRWDELEGDRVVAQLRSLAAMGMAEGEGSSGDAIVFMGQESTDTLALLPAGRSFQMTAGGAPQFRFFESEPVWDAASDGRLTSAVTNQYRIEIRSADGKLERVVTRPWNARPVPDGDKQVMLDGIRQVMLDQGAPPQAVDVIMSQASFAESYPAFASVLAGPTGTLWVQRLQTPQDMAESGEFDLQDFGSNDWDVFDEEGRYLGVMTMPEKFQPLRVSGDTFWGVQRDEFDVQSVVRYRLDRG